MNEESCKFLGGCPGASLFSWRWRWRNRRAIELSPCMLSSWKNMCGYHALCVRNVSMESSCNEQGVLQVPERMPGGILIFPGDGDGGIVEQLNSRHAYGYLPESMWPSCMMCSQCIHGMKLQRSGGLASSWTDARGHPDSPGDGDGGIVEHVNYLNACCHLGETCVATCMMWSLSIYWFERGQLFRLITGIWKSMRIKTMNKNRKKTNRGWTTFC